MQPNQLRNEVIIPVLDYLQPQIPFSNEAVDLLLMTCAHESNMGHYIKQVEGPALGIYQMEPYTEKDIYGSYLAYNKALLHRVNRLVGSVIGVVPSLVCNLMYSTAMARVHYYRDSAPLPQKVNYVYPDGFDRDAYLSALAKYAKRVYNTVEGKATVEDYKDAYVKYVSEG